MRRIDNAEIDRLKIEIKMQYAQIGSFVVLLGGCLYFGFLKRPREMGFCILAGFLGLAFSNIDRIARFKGGGFEAEMRRFDAVANKETEPLAQQHDGGDRIQAYGLVGEESPKVLKAMLDRSYTWRYVQGISEQSGVKPEKVQETLDWLFQNSLATSIAGDGGELWALTRQGRDAFSGLARQVGGQ